MKRFGTIVTTLLVLVALTQCKKEEQPTPANGSEAVTITLDLKSNGGTRVDVNTTTGEVTYQNGDVIYVASGGHYIGTLTYNGTNFTGTITNPTVGEPLFFYFLGNVTPAETLTAGTTTTCSVVISDQTEHLPVIEYAPSDETYTAGATTFTAFLLNKCALVKFNVTTLSEATTCVMGFNNKVTVNFTDVSFIYSQTNGGSITLPSGSGEKWAILLPQEAMEAGEAGSAYSMDGAYTGTYGAVPAIYDNGFLTSGVEVNVTAEVNPGEVPDGAISGKFTINENGDQVYFSQGNLQYIGSATTPYWKFAENQWDYLGTTTEQNCSAQNVDRDLFGWGTSGYDHGANCYQPWSTSQTNSDYYIYGSYTCNLYDQTGQADWGYNPISNGGNIVNQWRTLTTQEWQFVFNNRISNSGIRYAKANLNNVNGVILLPDNWNNNFYSLNNTNQHDASFSSNMMAPSQWSTLEQAGAIFLPAAGYRNGTSVNDVGSIGAYWSASYGNSYGARYILFTNDNLNVNYFLHIRYFGFSVRLVCPAD